MKGRRVPLNPDHTHFILIDNGLMGEPAYGGEIVMRAMIEEAIAAPKEGKEEWLRLSPPKEGKGRMTKTSPQKRVTKNDWDFPPKRG